jgi:hypothetical protein
MGMRIGRLHAESERNGRILRPVGDEDMGRLHADESPEMIARQPDHGCPVELSYPP